MGYFLVFDLDCWVKRGVFYRRNRSGLIFWVRG